MYIDEMTRTGMMDYWTFFEIISQYYTDKYDNISVTPETISEYIKVFSNPNRKNQIPLIAYHDNAAGKGSFLVSEEDVKRIFEIYLAKKNYVLDTIEFNKQGVGYVYKPKTDEITIPEPAKIDITYKYDVSYELLRGIIVEYYLRTQKVKLSYPSIDYFVKKLKDPVNSYPYPYFSFKDDMGNETGFDISIDEIKTILSDYFGDPEKGIEIKPESISFESNVKFEYKIDDSKMIQTNTEKTNVEGATNITKPQLEGATNLVKEVEEKEKAKEKTDLEKPKVEEKKTDETKEPEKEKEIPVREEELRRAKRERRRFWIIQRHRALNEAEKKQITSGICAGLCFLGLSAAIFFNPAEANRVLQDEIKMIYSWEAVVQYLKDIGPLETLLAAGAGTFIATYLRSKKEAKKIQGELEDFWESLEGGRRL